VPGGCARAFVNLDRTPARQFVQILPGLDATAFFCALSEVMRAGKPGKDALNLAVKARDIGGYLEADRAFHEAFVARAGNPKLTKIIMGLRDEMRLFGIDSADGEERQRASVKEHYELINLAVKGETKAIASLITSHIMDWQPIFRKALMSRTARQPL
jgi:DNA-binding GntR family transcriptional regulator